MILLAPLAVIGLALIPSFIMMSGYSFRMAPMKRCAAQQSRLMLKPYLYTMVCCALLHFCTRYLLCRSVRATVGMTWQVLGGFLMALPDVLEINGTLFYNCGAMWYLIALYLGWSIWRKCSLCESRPRLSRIY